MTTLTWSASFARSSSSRAVLVGLSLIDDHDLRVRRRGSARERTRLDQAHLVGERSEACIELELGVELGITGVAPWDFARAHLVDERREFVVVVIAVRVGRRSAELIDAHARGAMRDELGDDVLLGVGDRAERRDSAEPVRAVGVAHRSARVFHRARDRHEADVLGLSRERVGGKLSQKMLVGAWPREKGRGRCSRSHLTRRASRHATTWQFASRKRGICPHYMGSWLARASQ